LRHHRSSELGLEGIRSRRRAGTTRLRRSLKLLARFGAGSVGGISAISQSCYTGRPAGRSAGVGMRGVHVWIVTVSIFTPATIDSIASRATAGQAASADASTVRSPPQRLQPHCRGGPRIRSEPATGSTRRGAGGAEGRKPDWLLQPRTPGGEVPAHLSGGGATDRHKVQQAIGETYRSAPGCSLLAGYPVTGRRRAAVRLLPDFRGRRVCRLLARPVGDTHARGRRLHLLRERRAPRPVLRPSPISRGSDLLLSCAARCFDSVGMTPPIYEGPSIKIG